MGDGKKNTITSKEYISGDVKFIISIITAAIVIISIAVFIPRVSIEFHLETFLPLFHHDDIDSRHNKIDSSLPNQMRYFTNCVTV